MLNHTQAELLDLVIAVAEKVVRVSLKMDTFSFKKKYQNCVPSCSCKISRIVDIWVETLASTISSGVSTIQVPSSRKYRGNVH